MKYTPEEIAELLKERPNQPHYIAALVRRAVNQAVAAEREKWGPVLQAVIREIPRRGQDDGNAPGHAHAAPGIWDSDNGPLSGTECAWCKAWSTAKAVTRERGSS
jgi:hypothetical protein